MSDQSGAFAAFMQGLERIAATNTVLCRRIDALIASLDRHSSALERSQQEAASPQALNGILDSLQQLLGDDEDDLCDDRPSTPRRRGGPRRGRG